MGFQKNIPDFQKQIAFKKNDIFQIKNVTFQKIAL